MPQSKHMRHFLGELTEADVGFIVQQLDFCDRLARQVNEHYEGDIRPMIDRLEGLLRRAKSREAIEALEKGQCEETVDGERCWLVAGHEGEHRRQADAEDGS